MKIITLLNVIFCESKKILNNIFYKFKFYMFLFVLSVFISIFIYFKYLRLIKIINNKSYNKLEVEFFENILEGLNKRIGSEDNIEILIKYLQPLITKYNELNNDNIPINRGNWHHIVYLFHVDINFIELLIDADHNDYLKSILQSLVNLKVFVNCDENFDIYVKNIIDESNINVDDVLKILNLDDILPKNSNNKLIDNNRIYRYKNILNKSIDQLKYFIEILKKHSLKYQNNRNYNEKKQIVCYLICLICVLFINVCLAYFFIVLFSSLMDKYYIINT